MEVPQPVAFVAVGKPGGRRVRVGRVAEDRGFVSDGLKEATLFQVFVKEWVA